MEAYCITLLFVLQLCWWWCSGSVGHHFIQIASCGVSWMSSPVWRCFGCSSMSTSSRACFSTSARLLTLCSTTSCPAASVRCSRTWCAFTNEALPTGSTLWAWHKPLCAVYWAMSLMATLPLMEIMSFMNVMKTRLHVTERKKQTHFNFEVCWCYGHIYAGVYINKTMMWSTFVSSQSLSLMLLWTFLWRKKNQLSDMKLWIYIWNHVTTDSPAEGITFLKIKRIVLFKTILVL